MQDNDELPMRELHHQKNMYSTYSRDEVGSQTTNTSIDTQTLQIMFDGNQQQVMGHHHPSTYEQTDSLGSCSESHSFKNLHHQGSNDHLYYQTTEMGMNADGPYHQTSIGFEGHQHQQPNNDVFIYEQT